MRSALLTIALAPLLAGCPQLDALVGKASSKQDHERRQALLLPEPVAVLTELAVVPEPAPVVAPEPEPVVATAAPEPEPLPVAEEPECVPVFRVVVCP